MSHSIYSIELVRMILSECHSAAKYMARHGTLPEALSTRAYNRIIADSAWFNRLVREAKQEQSK